MLFMDELTQFNQERWNALVEAGIQYGQPLLDLTPDSARTMVDDCGVMAPVGGKDVLCLASGGGQQSPAFALLGARVTVVDFAEKQLAQDALALAHYGLTGRLEQGDMRDLSRFADNSFDLVWHAFSLNFIPDPLPVFNEVRRVLRPGGQYRLQHHNPLAMDADEERWDGYGYPVRTPQIQGQEITFASDEWEIEQEDATVVRVVGPHEFRHTLPTVLNGLCQRGFVLQAVREDPVGDPDAAPGSWAHYCAVTCPWLTSWWQAAN